MITPAKERMRERRLFYSLSGDRYGAVTHLDSLGNTGRISAGDVQVISAGTVFRHADSILSRKRR
jgi:redox-sensitive bicupin YhaK (pirin superfamily)